MEPKQFHDVVKTFPEVEFTTSHGQPTYKAFGKFLTRLREEDDSVVLGQVPFYERDLLCEADPGTFHFTDHYKSYPMVLARLRKLDAKTLREYLTRQWRHNAPKRWLKAYDAGETPPPFVKEAAKPRTVSRRSRSSPGRG